MLGNFEVRSRSAELWAHLFRARWPGLAARCGVRLAKAVHIIQSVGSIAEGQTPGDYMVRSESGQGLYAVDMVRRTCTCADHRQSRDLWICKHRLAIGMCLYGNDWQATPEGRKIVSMRTLRGQADEAHKRAGRLVDILQAAGERNDLAAIEHWRSVLAEVEAEAADLEQDWQAACVREGWQVAPAISIVVPVVTHAA